MGIAAIGRAKRHLKPLRHIFEPASGISVMASPRPTLNVTSAYDAFLFAPIVDESGVTRLSVLSALARTDVDPWEEAARLAALSTSDAERSLLSTLNLFPGHPQSSLETETLAARLVALLPKARAVTTAKVATITGSHEQRTNYWLVWLCFGIVMSFLSPHQHATTATAGDSASTSNAARPTEGRGAEAASSDANGRADLGEAIPPAAPSAGSMAR
jgi:hypothetical protein